MWEVVSVNKKKLPAGVASGDLCVVREVSLEEKKDKDRRKPLAIASFHGDTSGLQTVDVVKAVHNECGDSTALIFALDANCHHDDNKGKRLSVETMYGSLAAENLQNCWADEPHALPDHHLQRPLFPPTAIKQSRFLQRKVNEQTGRQTPERSSVRFLWTVQGEYGNVQTRQRRSRTRSDG